VSGFVTGNREQGSGWRYSAAAIAAWQVLFIALLLAQALTAAIDYDEEQYVAAGFLARHLMLYRDFIYLQSPAEPLLLAAVYDIIGGYYLLTARLVTAALAILVYWLIGVLLRRYGVGQGLSVMLASIVMLSPFLDRPLATARNDILPLALFLGGLLLYLEAPKRRWTWFAAAGFCVGLAVEGKVSYVFAPIGLLVHAACLRPRLPRLGPLAAGIAIAALPGLFYLAAAPDHVWYDLVEYHMTAPFAWYQRQDQAQLLTPGYRLAALGVLLAWGSNASLTMLVVSLAAIRLYQHATDTGPAAAPPGLLGLLLAMAVLVGFQPSPTWPMYYAPVAPLLAALAASMFMRIRTFGPPALVPLLLLIAATPSLPPLGHALAALPGLARPLSWPGIAVHRQAQALARTLGAAGVTGDVATLFPSHVLDTETVRPEFASGPFFFRTADLLPPQRIALLRGASAERLDTLFDAAPPAAIVGGFAAGQWSVEMDDSLRDYALRHGYRPTALEEKELWPSGAWLYLRDTATADSGRHSANPP
jgi:hypothetical protein